MNSVLHGDCIEVILKFLDPMDIANLAKAKIIKPKHLAKFYNRFKSTVATNIDNWFRKYFSTGYDEFKDIMIRNGGIISGSFIIQMILNTNWEESDIDIFLPLAEFSREVTHFHEMETFLYKSYPIYQTEEEFNRPHIRYIGVLDSKVKSVYEYETTQVTGIMNFKKLQVIGLNVTTPQEIINNIVKNSDIDICKNFFSYNADGTLQLNIAYPSKIINKTATLTLSKTGYLRCSNFMRYNRYKNRGFTFVNELDISVRKAVHMKHCKTTTIYSPCRCDENTPIL